jgi:tRNA (guanine-N7-)-methyltransferase
MSSKINPSAEIAEIDSVNPFRSLVEAASDGIIVNTAGHPTEDDIAAVRDHLRQFPRVIFELGSGSGRHLITLAERSPEELHVGMELRYKRAYRTIEKARNRGFSNLIVLRADARHLPILCEESSIDAIYINFPDPWDKRRWLKNRLIQPEFVDAMGRLLKVGGVLSYKTDHPDYFSSAVEVMRACPLITESRLTTNLAESPWGAESIPTEFECLFRSKGIPIQYALFERVG